ncbi:hypothetical protein FJ970_21885 [Mesorhizobium sp. B2-1-8]|uniref:hypothetical protein n=1 Tax=Mesorhizobium sp. B2-1-8 TaxID=2589967 RepID=UPI00112ED10C|nr:hypothetical protein [Mesorhizobium sp. B2-1-8]UCI17743.1 hypothetical protein FJ970_21885 [Mesorhizobium sp. B2-1-8]
MAKETVVFTRAAIAEMVGPDFDLLRSHVNPNLSHREIGQAWDAELGELLASHVAAAGIRDNDDAKRFAEIYLEEQKAMTDRLVEQKAFNHQMHDTVARTVVRASIWSMIFQIFR